MKWIYTTPLLITLLPPVFANSDLDDLMNLDIESLSMLDVEMQSASKTSQKLSDIPSSVFVLSNERITRSGYDNIAQVMSLVPGFYSSKYDEQGSIVSARGFHDSLYNKMLVLVDGRSVFSPTFGGVYWADLDYLLHDIERIEVLKGPGGAMWGANAANGVVNIITKSAQSTVGGYAEINVGQYQKNAVALRYGHEFDNDVFGRVFYQQRNVPLELSNDAFKRRSETAGLVLENFNDQNKWALRIGGERSAYDEDFEHIIYDPYDPYYSYNPLVNEDIQRVESYSYYVQLTNQWQQTNGNTLNSSFYLNHDKDEDLYSPGKYTTYDVDVNYHAQPTLRTALATGLGLRYLDLYFDNTQPNLDWSNQQYSHRYADSQTISDSIFNVYLQAATQWTNQLSTVIGAKAEYVKTQDNWYLSPQLRALYKFNEQHSLWSGYSQATMLPSYLDTDTTTVDYYPYESYGEQIYGPTTVFKNPDLRNEQVNTLELGYRFTPNYWLSFDLTGFASQYENVPSYQFLGYSDLIWPGDELKEDLTTSDRFKAKTWGLEAAGNYQARENLDFYLSYSFLRIKSECTQLEADEICDSAARLDIDAQHLASLQMLWSISEQWQFDVITKYQNNRFPEASSDYNYDSYLSLDARLAWQYRPTLPRVEIIGQNIGSSSIIDSWIYYRNEPQLRARVSLDF